MRPSRFPVSWNALLAFLLLSSLVLPTAGLAAAQNTCSPVITVDAPTEGGSLRGLTTIRGWAVDVAAAPSASGIQNIFFYLDRPADDGGLFLGEATLGTREPTSTDPGLVRTDVDAALGRQNNRAGFTGNVDVSNVASGPHALFVYAETRCGFSNIQMTVNVEPGANITLSAPAPNSTVVLGSNVTITGRATDPAGPASGVSMVDVYLDGPAGTGTGIGRAELNTQTGEFSIPWTVGGPTGIHSLYVYAMTASSGWVSRSFNVNVGTTAAPATATQRATGQYVFRIELPPPGAVVNATRNFIGVVVNCETGRGPTRMRVYAGTGPGGTYLGEATPTQNREIEDFCSGERGSADIGFNFSLDTRRLSEGTQTLAFVAEFPEATITETTTVFVDNVGTGNLNNVCTAFDVNGRCISYTNTNALYGNCLQNPNLFGTSGLINPVSNTTFCGNITLDQAGLTVAPNATINLTGQVVCHLTAPGADPETVTIFDRTPGGTATTVGRANQLINGVYRVTWNTQGVRGTRTLEVVGTGACGTQSAFFTVFVGEPGPGLSAPPNVTITENSPTSFLLSWVPIASALSNPSGITGYRVYRSSSSQLGSFTLQQFVSGANTSSVVVTIPTPGATQFFYVTAVDVQGRESAPSNIVSTTGAGVGGGITISNLTVTKNPPVAVCPVAPTPCVVRFTFNTSVASTGTLRWGTVGSGRPNAQSDFGFTTSHTIDVTFPSPGTYEYQVTASSGTMTGTGSVQTIVIP